ncbi:MAG: hypothetical protein U0931_19735 [Vulcanimicrobiota bacterium]
MININTGPTGKTLARPMTREQASAYLADPRDQVTLGAPTCPPDPLKKAALQRNLARSNELQEAISSIAKLIEVVRGGNARPTNAPSADLFKKPVDHLWEQLHSPAMLEKVGSDGYLKALHTQTCERLKHVRLEYDITTPTYVHEHVLQGSHPFEPTLGALKDTRNFLRALDGTESAELKVKETPGQIQAELAELETRHTAYIKGIIQNPMEFYQDFKARLTSQGNTAKFPEFADLMRHLELHLLKESVGQETSSNKHLAVLRKTALEELKATQEAGFPYRQTLDAVENTLGFLDVFERGRPNSEARPVLYHGHRYQYYTHFLKDTAPDHVTFPTFYGLGATDLLKTRGVPIGFVGVPAEISWVDGYTQTPLEFWFHDVNHVRRMWQFASEHAEKMGISIDEAAARSDRYIKEKVIPLIKIDKGDSEEVKNEKRMMKLIFFEILHEDALPADPEVIKGSLMRAPNTITPFERLVNDETKVEYIMEPGATTLAYVYRKAAGNFYDMPGMRMENIVGSKFRTQEFISHCAKKLAAGLGLDVPHDKIDEFARDDTGMPGDFRAQLEKQLMEDPERMAPLNMKENEPLKPPVSLGGEGGWVVAG